MAEPVTNSRTIQRWEEDCAVTHNGKVGHSGGVIELQDATGTYQMQVDDLNDLIDSQISERLAAGYEKPVMAHIPKSMLRKVS
jgi:hypothetical protein